MTVPSYTEEDVERLAQVIFNANAEPWPNLTIPADRYARAILAALSSAGRLVAPGSEVREEWGVRHHFQTGALGDTRLDSEEHAMEVLIARVACGLRTDLISRRVICTPWSPSVPDTKEGPNGG